MGTAFEVFVDNLDRIMEAKRLKPKDLAAGIKKSPSQFNRYISGQSRMSLEALDLIASFLKVPPHALLVPVNDAETVLRALKSFGEPPSTLKPSEIGEALQIFSEALFQAGLQISEMRPEKGKSLRDQVSKHDRAKAIREISKRVAGEGKGKKKA